jgi:hypothetical protein
MAVQEPLPQRCWIQGLRCKSRHSHPRLLLLLLLLLPLQ